MTTNRAPSPEPRTACSTSTAPPWTNAFAGPYNDDRRSPLSVTRPAAAWLHLRGRHSVCRGDIYEDDTPCVEKNPIAEPGIGLICTGNINNLRRGVSVAKALHNVSYGCSRIDNIFPQIMCSPCERCRRRDEQDYRDLDDCQKYFLLPMMSDFQHEMTIPGEFVQRFKGDIPGEIQRKTRNGSSHTVRVDRSQEKFILTEGWARFVKAFDLKTGDSMMFRFNGNSQFDVIIFDQVGREKAHSVVVDASVHPNMQKRSTDATETPNNSHVRPGTIPMQSPTETHANRSPMQMPDLSHAHAQPMQMQTPPTQRQTKVQRGNRATAISSSESSGDSWTSENHDRRVISGLPDPITTTRNKLTSVQKKVARHMVQNINSEIPMFCC